MSTAYDEVCGVTEWKWSVSEIYIFACSVKLVSCTVSGNAPLSNKASFTKGFNDYN